MKISLVVPDFLSGTSFLQQPLDFLYLTTRLRQMGHEIEVLDCRVHHLSIEHTVERIRESELIVVTTTPIDQVQNYFTDYRYAYTILTINTIREKLPGKILVVYGAHVTVRPDLVVREINADVYIIGEVWAPAQTIVEQFHRKDGWAEIPNLIINDPERGLFYTREEPSLKHPVIPDDVLPAYDAVEMDMYFGASYYENTPVIRRRRCVASGGRGCPFSCSFCHNYFGKTIHRRSPETVARELSILQNEYGIQEVFFLDEVFTLNRNWVYDLCDRMAEAGVHLDLTIQTRVDCLDDEMLLRLKEMGVKDIWLGVESADDAILGLMKKGTTIDQVNRTIDLVKSVGLSPNAFFMIGGPGESISSINKLIREIYVHKVPYTRSIMVCTPRYGTEYYRMAQEQYPEINDSWFNLNKVRGLVANEMTPLLIKKAKQLFNSRDFIYEDVCPILEA